MNTKAIITKLYPIVDKSLSKNVSKYKKLMSTFIERRSQDLFDTVPCSRLFYNDNDREELFTMMGIKESEVQSIINETYYGNITKFNPASAKDPTTVLGLTIVRYFFTKKMSKELELACIYLSFSGKMYPSVHYRSWNIEPARHVLEYVVNNKLSRKYDIVSQGSVFGAVKSISTTWMRSYDDKLKLFRDEDVVYLIQQLHDRIGSFIKNIAEEYYDSYANKDDFVAYSNDDLSDDNYHIADSDSLKGDRVVEATMEKLTSSRVDYNICKMCSDENIKTDEIKSIMESILLTKNNIGEVRELVTIVIMTYFVQSKNKDVRDIDFITYSLAPKPNTKDVNILRSKEIVENWLTENSQSYIRRKSRLVTKNSYNKAVLMYIVLFIHITAKGGNSR